MTAPDAARESTSPAPSPFTPREEARIREIARAEAETYTRPASTDIAYLRLECLKMAGGFNNPAASIDHRADEIVEAAKTFSRFVVGSASGE